MLIPTVPVIDDQCGEFIFNQSVHLEIDIRPPESDSDAVIWAKSASETAIEDLVRAKGFLIPILAGRPVSRGGEPVWDPWFLTDEAAGEFERLENGTPVRIYRDFENEALVLYGGNNKARSIMRGKIMSRFMNLKKNETIVSLHQGSYLENDTDKLYSISRPKILRYSCLNV